MSVLLHYKSFENRVVHAIGRWLRTLANVTGGFVRTAIVRGRERITVLVVPDSQSKVASFGFSIFSLVFVVIFLSGIVAATVVSRLDGARLSQLLSLKSSNLAQSQASLQKIEDPVAAFTQVAGVFRVTMDKTLSAIGLEQPAALQSPERDGVVSYQPAGQATSLGLGPAGPSAPASEGAELQSVLDMMNSSVTSLQKIATFYTSHVRVLTELPTMWPVQGGYGVITTNFGPAIQPFTHSMYLHLGVDIAYSEGSPLVAAGDGVVTQIGYQPLGYGNFVMIRHNYGFYTRYAHMRVVYAHVNQQVKQGEVIGLLGSTGLSTGPHVHFEVYLGDQVIDPMSFLGIGHEYHATAVSQD